MEPQCDLLFVYGTLKRGHGNHHQLAGAGFVGEATMAGVDLHDLGPFPMAISGEGLARGELYRVDAGTLARLDRFEGVPRLYRRECRGLDDGRQAWIYLGQPRQVRHSPRLRGGCWPAAAADASADATAGAAVPDAGSGGLGGDAARVALALLRHSWHGWGPCLRQVLIGVQPRWSERLGRGRTPYRRRRIGLLLALPALLQPLGSEAARADASLAQCQRWQHSSGEERIRLGNSIGAAAYLTKVQRFAESDPQHPQPLYAASDLQRACDGWR